jgi:hypothetical protein
MTDRTAQENMVKAAGSHAVAQMQIATLGRAAPWYVVPMAHATQGAVGVATDPRTGQVLSMLADHIQLPTPLTPIGSINKAAAAKAALGAATVMSKVVVEHFPPQAVAATVAGATSGALGGAAATACMLKAAGVIVTPAVQVPLAVLSGPFLPATEAILVVGAGVACFKGTAEMAEAAARVPGLGHIMKRAVARQLQ